jgi:hypothetical protein
MGNTWTSEEIRIDGMTLRVEADAQGVTAGRTVDGVYASDLHLTADEAVQYANALNAGAAQCRAMRGDV